MLKEREQAGDTGGKLRPPLLGEGLDPAKMPGHLLLAQLGKRVLRPGGIGMTKRLLAAARIGSGDHVVEFGPGTGSTARRVLAAGPASYTGVDRDELAVAATTALLDPTRDQRCVIASAEVTTLADGAATVVIGEAMLTMQREQRKREIVAEAWRLLAPGGRYVVHELAFRPDDLDEEIQDEIAATLSKTIHVGARPLTAADWRRLLTDQGFVVREHSEVAMSLLQPLRVLRDEGGRTVVIVFNLLRRPQSRRRVAEMRRMFFSRRRNMSAIGLVAVKPG